MGRAQGVTGGGRGKVVPTSGLIRGEHEIAGVLVSPVHVLKDASLSVTLELWCCE